MSLRLAFSRALNATNNGNFARVMMFKHNPDVTTSIAGGPMHLIARGMASKKHKNLLKHAKGYRGRSKNCFRIAIRRVHKAWQYAYRDRRQQRREWRKLWITRIQAGVRQYEWNYSRFIPALQATNIQLNRKVLADLAANEPFSFKAVVDVVNQEHEGDGGSSEKTTTSSSNGATEEDQVA